MVVAHLLIGMAFGVLSAATALVAGFGWAAAAACYVFGSASHMLLLLLPEPARENAA